MSVETVIKGIGDRFAKGRQTTQGAFATGTDFWDRIDSAGDETFENRLKGSDITALDAALLSASFASVASVKQLFTLLNTYFQTDLSLAVPYIESYLALKGWRIPYEFAQAWYEATGYRINKQYVFGKGTRPADEADPSTSGMHCFETWVYTGSTGAFTVDDGALVNCVSPVLVTSTTASPGGSAHALTLTLSDGSTTRTVTFTPDATQYGHILVGQQAIGAVGAAAGQKDIPIAATAQFAASTWVLLVKSDYSVQELVYVASITTNTKLVATSNLINTFAENDLVLPLCTNATRQAGTLANDKAIAIWAWPDRIIAL